MSDYNSPSFPPPGSPPYTRGIHKDMYRGRLWTMRQYSGYATAAETNARYRRMLAEGQTGLSVAFDLPTQIGYDPDHPLARGEVGRVGVSIASLEDMRRLFDGIPLKDVSTSMTINATAAILLALYITTAKSQYSDANLSSSSLSSELRGTVQNDILKEYIARGTYIYPPAPSLRLAVDLMRFCALNVPQWNTISISGYHIREAGSTAAQELAFTLANGIAYCQAAIDAGLDVDSFAPRLSFFFNAHINLLEEVAKFRAARRMWCRIMQELFKAQDSRSWQLRFHTQTAGSSLTAQQPEVNVVRTTLEALAAVLGGTQSLHTNSLDEALGLPTEATARLALRTQQVIAYESGVVDEPDPLGGAPYIEQLTDRLEEEASKEIAAIDRLGGAVKAIEAGYQTEAIAKSAYRFQQEVESGRRVVVGVNRFILADEKPTEILRIPPTAEKEQFANVQKLRRQRENRLTQARLEDVKSAAAEANAPLMDPILAAVEADATVGEVADALRKVWGEHSKG
ncbi:MAG: methylmalonyl-CoA mutase [Calditrichaeota bacterium]|nr:methylmalonyl-CoA mutase [Calditrichota bacterium]